MEGKIKKYATWHVLLTFELTLLWVFYLKTEESTHSNTSSTESGLKVTHGFSDVTVPTIDVQAPLIFLFIFVP